MIKRYKGFTLVEMLLVLTIVSAILYMALGYFQQRALQMRIDRTVTQMQQILNAGLSYYIANNQWPVGSGTSLDITANPGSGNPLQNDGFLPKDITIASPWGGSSYHIYTDANARAFTVYLEITTGGGTGTSAGSIGNIIAGSLPIALTTPTAATPPSAGGPCTASDTSCWVSASVSIPGQNINNATSVNFTGVVKHGGCVPVPECPVDAAGNTMIPQVQIVPVSVSGFNDPGSDTVYPISSFTAYAKPYGANNVNPAGCDRPGGATSNAPSCFTSGSYQGSAPAKRYWRACLQIITEKGDVQSDVAADYGSKVELMAITRCQIQNETGTSTTSIYSN
jgi:prepilin-type N-terminal cleavage/methylation domain-containing protein